jgi:hypothetical protein
MVNAIMLIVIIQSGIMLGGILLSVHILIVIMPSVNICNILVCLKKIFSIKHDLIVSTSLSSYTAHPVTFHHF